MGYTILVHTILSVESIYSKCNSMKLRGIEIWSIVISHLIHDEKLIHPGTSSDVQNSER